MKRFLKLSFIAPALWFYLNDYLWLAYSRLTGNKMPSLARNSFENMWADHRQRTMCFALRKLNDTL